MTDFQQHETTNTPSRPAISSSPFLIVSGFMILGLVLMLALFGDALWSSGDDREETAVLPQVPALSENASESTLPTGGGGPVTTGNLAYDFVLPDLAGNEVRLADFHGRPVILNFWATWCAPCRVEMPELEAAQQNYSDEGLVILALNQQEDPADVRAFFYDEMGLTFTPLLDSEGTVQELYGLSNILPTTFFVNGEGLVTAVHRGPLTQSQIAGYMAATLP